MTASKSCGPQCIDPTHPAALAYVERLHAQAVALQKDAKALLARVEGGEDGVNTALLLARSTAYLSQSEQKVNAALVVLDRVKRDHGQNDDD